MSTQQHWDVVGIGNIVVDHLALVDHHPQPNEKMAASRILLQPGGPVPTALATLARLGRRTAFIGKTGADIAGEWLPGELARRGVDTRFLIRASGSRTPLAQIAANVTTGLRSVIYEEADSESFTEADLAPEKLPPARLVHVDGREHDVMPLALAEYRARKTPVSIDCGTFRRRTLELLPYADLIVMPLEFAMACFGNQTLEKIVANAHDAWPDAVLIVVTDGTNGSAGWADGKILAQPAFPVRTVDSCGAGDIHAGAIVHAFLENMPLDDALRFAAAAAALKCTVAGNGEKPGSVDEVDAFIKER